MRYLVLVLLAVGLSSMASSQVRRTATMYADSSKVKTTVTAIPLTKGALPKAAWKHVEVINRGEQALVVALTRVNDSTFSKVNIIAPSGTWAPDGGITGTDTLYMRTLADSTYPYVNVRY